MSLYQKPPKKIPLWEKLLKGINGTFLRLNLFVSFLGIFPLILFIYFNLWHFDAIKVLVGCLCLLTLIKANKSMQ